MGKEIVSLLDSLLKKQADIVDDKANHRKAEERENDFAPVDSALATAKLHTKGEAIILDIAEVKPTEDLDTVANLQVVVYGELYNLVDSDKHNDQCREFCASRKLI